MFNSLCNFNKDNLSVETCILELVKISLKRKATSIAVRFNPKKHKIQVVDNGIGFTKYELSVLFSEDETIDIKVKTIFDKIIYFSNAVIVTSKSEFSSRTYVKVASSDNKFKLFQGYDRPSKGTTVTIYEFNSSKWNSEDKNSSISYVIAAVAFTELKVSFSLRNDDQNNLILDIRKPHSPWEVLKYFKANRTSELPFETISQMMPKSTTLSNETKFKFNQEPITFSPINMHLDNVLDDKIQKFDNNICSPLSEWSDWPHSPKNNATKNALTDKIANSSSKNNSTHFNINNDNFINLSQMSVWSDCSYQSKEPKTKVNKSENERNKCLPISCYEMLPSKGIFSNSHLSQIVNETTRYFPNLANIRICDMKQRYKECKISGNTINSLQILKQINTEIIVAIANENGKKLLLLIDQHAVHERIRYEWLIEIYREEGSNKYYSVKLDEDLIISNIDKKLLQLLTTHQQALERVGIRIKSVIDSSTCAVDAVPKCFMRNVKTYKHEYNVYRLMKNVRQLLIEVAKGLAISRSVLPPVLPIAINNVIASEACHEAIKFGDPLTVKECTLLMQALKDTKAPTRCAHGRPSIVPIMDLTDLERRKNSGRKKLNLFNLKKQTLKIRK